MALTLYHRTSIGEARTLVQRGFTDAEWDFGLQDARTGEDAVVTGVWVADRPLGQAEGIEGDAALEIMLDTSVEDLREYELEGMLWDARVWVVPADMLNAHATSRILSVDPSSSWTHKAWNGDAESEPES